MPTTLTYISVSLSFAATYICCLASICIQKWLIYESPRPYKTVTNYGLYRKCSTLDEIKCRDFPLIEYGDCEEAGFCEEWKAARTVMVFAAVLGGLTLIYCIGVFFSGKFHREEVAWKIFVGLIAFHSILQLSSISSIIHLLITSDKFTYGVRFDISFYLATLSSIFNLALAVSLFMIGRSFRPQYQTIDD